MLELILTIILIATASLATIGAALTIVWLLIEIWAMLLMDPIYSRRWGYAARKSFNSRQSLHFNTYINIINYKDNFYDVTSILRLNSFQVVWYSLSKFKKFEVYKYPETSAEAILLYKFTKGRTTIKFIENIYI